MRKNIKSTLAANIETVQSCVEPPSICSFIEDGEFLLHVLVWKESDTYRDVCLQYVKFVQKCLSSCEAVVFGRYTYAL